MHYIALNKCSHSHQSSAIHQIHEELHNTTAAAKGAGSSRAEGLDKRHVFFFFFHHDKLA